MRTQTEKALRWSHRCGGGAPVAPQELALGQAEAFPPGLPAQDAVHSRRHAPLGQQPYARVAATELLTAVLAALRQHASAPPLGWEGWRGREGARGGGRVSRRRGLEVHVLQGVHWSVMGCGVVFLPSLRALLMKSRVGKSFDSHSRKCMTHHMPSKCACWVLVVYEIQ